MLHFRFIAGVAAGALVILAFNNRKSIKKSVIKGVVKGVVKTKEMTEDIVDSTKATIECIKSKKEAKETNEC